MYEIPKLSVSGVTLTKAFFLDSCFIRVYLIILSRILTLTGRDWYVLTVSLYGIWDNSVPRW